MKKFYSTVVMALVLGTSHAALAERKTIEYEDYGPTEEGATKTVKKWLEDSCKDRKGKVVAGSFQVKNIAIDPNPDLSDLKKKYKVKAEMKCDVSDK
ncbi:MAG: hypothetical protein FWD69_19730 [Polyangiaceae bacterium]|nr:hypothetical protein [Polyangiaceae bacterium]